MNAIAAAREQKVRDIGAGDQQDAGDGSHHQWPRLLYGLSGEAVHPGNDPDGAGIEFRVLPHKSGCDVCDIRLGPLFTHARLQAADEPDSEFADAILHTIRGEDFRHP